ncbi:MAG TPA: hypothetical protein VL283_04260 [Candidatus Baltobacteraceae bacterium]|nr:hypothetical protein [Candidatus Baltobacteraceae bacterium]
MKRMTVSLLVTAAVLVIGSVLIWLMFASLRRQPAGPPPATTTPETGSATEPEAEFHGALNLYLAAPDQLPAGAGRVELTLVKAALVRADGKETAFFEGSRRVVLQQGVTEKALSEMIPNGRWSRLKLTFSPAADISFSDGRPTASALLDRHEAILSFDADVPVSRTLALFARLPLDAASGQAAGVTTIGLSPEPRPAERYVFGAFLYDPRDHGDLWNIPSPSLAAIVKEDLGFDITRAQTGSSGFVPADRTPSAQTPQ